MRKRKWISLVIRQQFRNPSSKQLNSTNSSEHVVSVLSTDERDNGTRSGKYERYFHVLTTPTARVLELSAWRRRLPVFGGRSERDITEGRNEAKKIIKTHAADRNKVAWDWSIVPWAGLYGLGTAPDGDLNFTKRTDLWSLLESSSWSLLHWPSCSPLYQKPMCAMIELSRRLTLTLCSSSRVYKWCSENL